jgi:hypothetical protein
VCPRERDEAEVGGAGAEQRRARAPRGFRNSANPLWLGCSKLVPSIRETSQEGTETDGEVDVDLVDLIFTRAREP